MSSSTTTSSPYKHIRIPSDRPDQFPPVPMDFAEPNHPHGFFPIEDAKTYLSFVKQAPVGIIVECGVLIGRSTSFIVPYLREHGYEYYAVDIFNMPMCYESFMWNMKQLGFSNYIHVIREDSVQAAKHFQDTTVSGVLIDTLHTYEHTKAELDAWWPKIKTGGFIGGHDYTSDWKGVIQAVNEKFGQPETQTICWKVVKKNV